MRLLSLLDYEKEQELAQLESSAPIKKLNEAAMAGDVPALLGLLETDPSLLDRSNPLHVSALLGHSSFVHELLTLNPKLAGETNRRGSLPLHVAAAKGHLEIVKKLLKVHPDACLVWDVDGRTPLHLAAIKGRIQVVTELVRVAPESARVLTKGGESALHLCLRHNRVEALKVLVECIGSDDGFLNWKDCDGNSVLHIAVEKKQLEIVKYFLYNTKIDANAQNAKGFTPIDVLTKGKRDVRDLEINKLLLLDLRSSKVHESPPFVDGGDTIEAVPMEVPNILRKMAGPKQPVKKHTDWLGRKRSALMVVASLIATVAFQGTLSPPGGFWQDDFTADPAHNGTEKSHKVGMAVMATTLPKAYGQFMIFNTLAFLSSLSIILLLVSGLPMKRRRWMWTLMVTMWIAITALTCTYFISWIHMTPEDNTGVLFSVTRVSVILWLCIMGIVFLGNVFRMGKWLLRKYGYIKEEEQQQQPSDEVYLEDEENDDL
ncbi:ankyrin repeat-containing protein At5g02620-like [Punica granatum]|uniref:PGG domain-containing protein n=2 Tax=Punica granatum TaxID=22663 RepID=A0A218XNI4_PUNGR|nr:ankyrin repeat-containing protein At5g02620-like [Punica granatum]OWM86547.1 hypothetical protein CDL15_Pgr015582 [Punica granatum]PKI72068.1 hypothetical protein CRG98_007525 [Punica granatum]